MIISIEERHLTKFNIRLGQKLNKVGTEGGTYLNIIKDIFDKITAKSYSMVKKLKTFLLRSGIRHSPHFYATQ